MSSYSLPTLEDVTSRLHNTKIFSVLDVQTGFWHVELDKKLCYLTTFNTPFGLYHWLCMPFGINSVPKIFQARMNQIVERLTMIEVYMDEFLIIGRGETQEEALADHDQNLIKFLECARERGLQLNPDKMELRKSKVTYISHQLTKGLIVDPQKVDTIMNMPPPKDVSGIKRLCVIVTNLPLFLPNLSSICAPLCNQEKKRCCMALGGRA